MEEGLVKIYKSAIKSMQKEISRLNSRLKYQKYSKKLEELQNKSNELTVQIDKTQEYVDNYKSIIYPTPRTALRKKSVSKAYFESMESQIAQMTQDIDKTKKRNMQEQDLLEQTLKEVNSNLYLLVLKFKEAKKENSLLKKEKSLLALNWKNLIKNYAKITNNLIKEPTLHEKLEKIDDLECKSKEKVTKINILKQMIEKVKEKKIPQNPEVKLLLSEHLKKEESRKKLIIIKDKLTTEIANVEKELVSRKENPEDIPLAVANKNMRTEINLRELEIAEKSKTIKEYEREKLIAQVNYSDTIKKLEARKPRLNPKGLSPSNTYSSLPKGRRHSGTNLSKESGLKSKRSSVDLSRILKKNTSCTITKDIQSMLNSFAPGKGITAKIIAFNREGHSFMPKAK